MTKEALISSHQIKLILTEAFSKIGNDLGDELYNIENITSNNNEVIKIEQRNDFIANELNAILANSYKRLFLSLNRALKDDEAYIKVDSNY